MYRKTALLLYRHLTTVLRRKLRAQFVSQSEFPAAVLFYHRIADNAANPWTMSTSQFTKQLDWLEANADVVSLDEIQHSCRLGKRNRLQVAITFDDGYSDNMEFAIPEICRRNLPCTYFVSNSFVRDRQAFPHDVERACPLPPNTKREIRQIADMGISIGAHTDSHLNLGKPWPQATLQKEIVDPRSELQDWTGQPIHHFAFPYGQITNHSQSAIDLIAKVGYRGFVSAYGDWNWFDSTPFHIRRIHADPCFQRFLNWLTFDPRKTTPNHHTDFPFTIPGPQIEVASCAAITPPTASPLTMLGQNSTHCEPSASCEPSH